MDQSLQPLLDLEMLRVAYPTPQSNQLGDRDPSLAVSPPSWAVNQVSLQLHPGESLGLVGESGSGKSTLGRAILRLLPPGSLVTGEMRFLGQSVLALSGPQLRQFRGEAVGLVFQDPMTRLDPLMTIGDHCLQTLKAHRPHLSRQQVTKRVREILETVNIPTQRWQQYPHEFSGGMRQRVAIALALLLNPQLIVADEPTTSLDVTVSAQILQELTRLCREREMALLLISHDLALVGQYCDQIAVMYNGELVEEGTTAQILQSPTHLYTQSLLKAALHLHGQEMHGQEKNDGAGEQPGTDEGGQESVTTTAAVSNSPLPDSSTSPPSQAKIASAPLLQLDEVKQYYSLETNWIERLTSRSTAVIKAVDDVSFALAPGEILGLVGESGCGKSTLCRTILQLIQPTAGRIKFLGQDLTTLSRGALRRQRRQMQMVFQDPHACLNPLMRVGESIADPLLIHGIVPNLTRAKSQVEAMLDRVGLTSSEFYYRYPHELSGGQQQRVAIARALITHPKLLICDEPVSMLDATVQAQVLDLMLALKQEFELTYLFITHDLWVAKFFCDRIAVMTGGKIVELNDTEALFNQPQHPYTQSLLQAAPSLI
jgi:peptide/nickel transport system ATP-binding protein